MRRHTKTTHFNAVAAVMSGCSLSGTSKAYDIDDQQLRRLLISPSTREVIDAMGRDLFLAKFYEPTKAAAIMARSRLGKKGVSYSPVR